MADEPSPPLPADCDLRSFPYMPLDVVRLRDSDTAALPSAEGFRAAVLLWCASWHQIPAASLPNDDVALCRLAGYGRDAKTWKKARTAGALRGWALHSDGRLYHPVVAEKAREAWESRKAQRQRTEAARKALETARQSPGKKDAAPDAPRDAVPGSDTSVTDAATDAVTETATKPVTENVTGSATNSVTVSATDSVTASNLTEGKGKEVRGKEESSLASYSNSEAARESLNGHAVLPQPTEKPQQMPARNDPPHLWASLADGWEIDKNGVRSPVVGGAYLNIAADMVCDAARINAVSWRGDWRPLVAWLRDGLDLNQQIIPAIRRVAERQNYVPPRSLKYFDDAVRERRAA